MRFSRLLLTMIVLGLGACSSNEQATGTGRVDVVVTTPHLEDFVKNVGGDKVSVRNVLRPGVDPHDFEASPADIEAIRNADVVFRNGAGLESWFDATVRSSETKAKLVDASKNVVLREGDPHIWQSPLNAKTMVDDVTEALKVVSPNDAVTFDTNRAAYIAKLDVLDKEIAAQIASLPDKKIVTDHDAFGYYIDRYGLTFVGSVIPSFDSQAELSSQDINGLVNRIRSTGTKAIFVEQTLSPKTAETVAREAGVRVVSGEDSLFADTFAKSGDADNYIGVIRHNTSVITTNLR